MRKTYNLIVASLLMLSIVQCSKKDGTQEIVVGEYGSLTGPKATFGLSTKAGIDLATEEVNAAGGIHGKKIRRVVLDDRGFAEEAAQAVKRLITEEKVLAILGEVASSNTKAAAPIAQAAKIPMISPSSTDVSVTEIGDYIFRVCFIDPFQGYVMAKFASTNLNAKTAAILRDAKNDYSVGLSNVFDKDFKKFGGKIVNDLSYQEGDVNFKAQLSAIKASNPDVIYVPGYYTEVGLISRQARELGMKIPLLGGDGWDSAKLFEIGGKALEPSYLSNHYAIDDASPKLQEFVTKYEKKFGSKPDALAGLGYDAAMVLYEAMKRVPDLNPTKIRDEIAKTKGHQGVTGVTTINAKRNADKPAVVLKVENNGFKYVTTINPPDQSVN